LLTVSDEGLCSIYIVQHKTPVNSAAAALFKRSCCSKAIAQYPRTKMVISIIVIIAIRNDFGKDKGIEKSGFKQFY
jgi:hypothetical protein